MEQSFPKLPKRHAKKSQKIKKTLEFADLSTWASTKAGLVHIRPGFVEGVIFGGDHQKDLGCRYVRKACHAELAQKFCHTTSIQAKGVKRCGHGGPHEL